MRAARGSGEDELAGAARGGDPRVTLAFTQQRKPARGGHLDDRRRSVAEDPPLRIDLPEQRIVDPARAETASRRAHERVDRALAAVRERDLIELRVG